MEPSDKEKITKKDKQMLIIVGLMAFVVIAILIVLFFNSLSGGSTGLLKPDEDEEEVIEPITAADREAEYEARDELPDDIAENIQAKVLKYLTIGDFETLDSILQNWQNNYKDNSENDTDEMALIDKYRADIAYYYLVSDKNNEPETSWKFQTPDALAAAFAYTPISMKYQALMDQSSAVLPVARSNIALQETDTDEEMLDTMLKVINLTRMPLDEIWKIKIYNMSINGLDCQFIAAIQHEDGFWEPYSFTINNYPDFEITPAFITEQVEYDTFFDVDAAIAMPTTMEDQILDDTVSADEDDVQEEDLYPVLNLTFD